MEIKTLNCQSGKRAICKGKTIMGVDTIGSRLKIALMTPDGMIKKLVRKKLNQENLLFLFIDKLMNTSGLKLTDISEICALRGPGRFTGIRIGLTFARIMNALLGVHIVGLTAFEVLAFQAVSSSDFRFWLKNNGSGLIAVLLHAFKNEYYCQIYKLSDKGVGLTLQSGFRRGMLETLDEPKWMSKEEIKKYLNDFKCNLYCIGNMEESPDIYNLCPLNSQKAPSRISRILPENVILAGRLLSGSNVDPLYLKPAKYELKDSK